jgi:ribosomal protein S18 acetylase RimI-like enzyme
MAFRQVARVTEKFSISWPERFQVKSVSEDDAPEIGAFLLRVGHPLRPECETGTLEGATYYVTRLFDYHRTNRNYPLALQCSTIVRDTESSEIVGVCLVGGGGDDGKEFSIYDIQVDPSYQNQGLGTNMIKRSLTILAEHGIPEFHLWREDDSRAKSLYERLGFKPTGAVE